MCTRIRKGIINPNYPGFQSLAYTLNDDHFDYSSENPSDDEEDSYVSESDDNEIRRIEHRAVEVGDENGNSYNGGTGHGESGRAPGPERCVDGEKNRLAPTMEETVLGPTRYPSTSLVQRSRMRLIPTSPSSLTTMIEPDSEKLDTGGIYACTPPDIVLQHNGELLRPTSDGGATDEQLRASLELSNSRRPDLIPEHQQLEQEQKKNELNLRQGELPLQQLCAKELEHANELNEDELADADDDDDDDDDGNDNDGNEEIERTRTPPSPAIERGIGTISISASSSNSNQFLRNVTLSPDPMLEDATQCYGSGSDVTLSDDSDHSDPESDELEFGYRPYGCPDHDVAGSPDSGGDSAGSSPGEVQYHLVDDCSNQTVQITRSRQSGDHSPTRQYHALLREYSSRVPADYCNNLPRRIEREVNCNEPWYPSLSELAQTTGTLAPVLDECEDDPFQQELTGTDYPDYVLHTLSIHRRDPSMSAQESHIEHQPVADHTLHDGSNDTEKTNESNLETLGPGGVTRQFQKVPKVNPFSELLLQENDTCDFFTKQAKLQIEARMALCQAKDMAHMQMEIEKRSLLLSPVTQVIHTAVEKAGLSLAADKRRLSRYYLTRLNVGQLRTILLELQCHAEVLNEQLVQLLMERDELHISQDATLIDIEDLSRYLCAKEQTIIHAERQRKSYWNSNKTIYHPTHHPVQSQPQPPQMCPPSGAQSTISAYRYH